MLSQEEVELSYLRRLAASLDDMRQNSTMTDITLVCGDHEFPAHRLVLAAGSPYFESMLRSEWKDGRCERYDLPGWSADTVAAIVSFMYTGQLSEADLTDNKEDMTKLLEAADYFQIEDLVEYCFKTISDLTLTTTNFLEMYHLADSLSNQRQISRIENLLSPNLSEMSKGQDFLHLTRPQLERLLQHPKVNHNHMSEAFEALLKWTQFESERCSHLEDLVKIFNLYWCPVLLKDLILKNTLTTLWNSTIRTLLSRMYSGQQSPIMCHQLANHNLKLVCFGENSVQTYDVEQGDWLPAKQLPFYVDCKAAAVSYNRHIFFMGGETGIQFKNSSPASVIEYCPFLNSVVDAASGKLLFEVYCAGAGVFNDSIYVVNGQNKQRNALRMVQCYDPNDKKCHQVASTVKHHGNPYVFSFDNNLFVFGVTSPSEKTVERYNLKTNQWTELITVAGFYECTGVYHSAVSGTKMYSLNELNLEHPVYILDILSLGRDFVLYNGGPDILINIWSVKQNGKEHLLAIDHHNAPHFYDIEARLWVKEGPSNSGYKMWHHLSCCM